MTGNEHGMYPTKCPYTALWSCGRDVQLGGRVALWLELRTAITPSNEIEGSYDAIIITIVPVLSCVLFANNQ